MRGLLPCLGMGARPIPPKPFGHYTLVARLASGGMGRVYLAKDPGGDLVAIKSIHEHLAEQPKFVKMFHDEATIVSHIDHPNVCPVIEFGEEEGIPYLVMPFLSGKPLSQVVERLRQRPLDENAPFIFARMIADACEGLHAAHELEDDDGQPLEVVHRDVTPHNLFVGFDGIIRVLDFGVASAAQRLASTVTGEVKGKFAYMAPEHIDGMRTDRRADIWSLGVVLWEAIAGERLFQGESMGDTVKNVLSGAVPSLSEYRMDVPLGVEEVVFRALARDREVRFSDAHTMGVELKVALEEAGHEVSTADVAAFMADLFPEGPHETQVLIESARREPTTKKMRIRDDDTPVVPSSDLPISALHPRLGQLDDKSDAVTISRQTERRRPAWLPWVAGAGVVLMALVVVGLADDDAPAAPVRDMANPPLRPGFEVVPPDGDMGMGASDMAGMVASMTKIPEMTFALDETMVEAPVRVEQPELEVETPIEVVVDDSASELESETETETSDADAESESESPRMRAVRPRGRGRLSVATPGGWAKVYHAGRYLGDTAGTWNLPAGFQRVELQPFGRGPRSRHRVRIRPGQIERLSVRVSR